MTSTSELGDGVDARSVRYDTGIHPREFCRRRGARTRIHPCIEGQGQTRKHLLYYGVPLMPCDFSHLSPRPV